MCFSSGQKFLAVWCVVLLFSLCGLFSEVVALGQEQEFRTWTDDQGNTIEAKLKGKQGLEIELEKPDGTVISLPLTRLSHSDRVAVSRARLGTRKRNPAQPTYPVLDPQKYNLVELDFSTQRTIRELPGGWNLPPVETPKIDFDIERVYEMTIEGGAPREVLLDARVPGRAFVITTGWENSPDGFLVDTKSGASMGPINLPLEDAKIVGYDAERQVLVSTARWETGVHVHLWQLTGEGLKHQVCFQPTRAKLNSVRAAQYLQSGHLALVNHQQVIVVDLTKFQVLRSYKFKPTSQCWFNGDGRYVLGIDNDDFLTGVDLISGTATKAPLQLDSGGVRKLGMDSTHKKIAFRSSHYLKIYDLEKGQVVHKVVLPPTPSGQTYFLDDENILVYSNVGTSIINLRLKTAIASYQFGMCTPGTIGTNQFWFLGSQVDIGKYHCFVRSTHFPPEPELELIDSLDPEELVVLRPGDSISVDLVAAGEGAGWLMEQLREKGYKIDPASPNRLVASESRSSKGSTTYRDVRGGPSQTVQQRTINWELALIQNGEQVWRMAGGAASQELGNFVILQPGESVESKANGGLNRVGNFFYGIELPTEFIRMPKRGYYHRYHVTANGMEPFPEIPPPPGQRKR